MILGEKAGREAAAKIDVGKILADALAGAQKAADEAAKDAKEKEAAEQAEAVKAMIINEAKEAGKRVGFQTAQLFIAEELEALILPDVSKVCEEAGKAKGQQIICCCFMCLSQGFSPQGFLATGANRFAEIMSY